MSTPRVDTNLPFSVHLAGWRMSEAWSKADEANERTRLAESHLQQAQAEQRAAIQAVRDALAAEAASAASGVEAANRELAIREAELAAMTRSCDESASKQARDLAEEIVRLSAKKEGLR